MTTEATTTSRHVPAPSTSTGPSSTPTTASRLITSPLFGMGSKARFGKLLRSGMTTFHTHGLTSSLAQRGTGLRPIFLSHFLALVLCHATYICSPTRNGSWLPTRGRMPGLTSHSVSLSSFLTFERLRTTLAHTNFQLTP